MTLGRTDLTTNRRSPLLCPPIQTGAEIGLLVLVRRRPPHTHFPGTPSPPPSPPPPPGNTSLTSVSLAACSGRLAQAWSPGTLLSLSTVFSGLSHIVGRVSTSLLSATAVRMDPFYLYSVTSRHMELPRPRIKPKASGVEAQSLNHWTARELPIYLFPIGWAAASF